MAQVLHVGSDPDAAIDAAVSAISDGKCIVLPTDTVYGIAANAFDADAVQRLLNAKQRGRDMPPPVLIGDALALPTLAEEVTDQIRALSDRFWPGALTLIVRAPASLEVDLGERGSTIAVRIPDHDFTRDLLRATGPLAVSSANVSGRPAALSIAEAVEQLQHSVAVFLDDGDASGPVPSTIVDLTGVPRVLREGRITAAELREVLPELAEG